MRFEITYLYKDGGDRPSHEAGLGEIAMLVEWAGRTGVPVGIRPVTEPRAPDSPQHRESGHG